MPAEVATAASVLASVRKDARDLVIHQVPRDEWWEALAWVDQADRRELLVWMIGCPEKRVVIEAELLPRPWRPVGE